MQIYFLIVSGHKFVCFFHLLFLMHLYRYQYSPLLIPIET